MRAWGRKRCEFLLNRLPIQHLQVREEEWQNPNPVCAVSSEFKQGIGGGLRVKRRELGSLDGPRLLRFFNGDLFFAQSTCAHGGFKMRTCAADQRNMGYVCRRVSVDDVSFRSAQIVEIERRFQIRQPRLRSWKMGSALENVGDKPCVIFERL